MIKLSEVIAPSFYDVHKNIQARDYSSYWLKGGRGSTKSSFAAIQIILGIVADKDANALALRKVDNTVRRSVLETFLWAIDILDLNDYFEFTRSPAEITYIPTGQKILMSGLDDPRKLKSIKVKKGYFKFLWFEEAEEFNGIEELRSVQQSTRRGGKDFVEFISYNPPNDPAAWVNKEAEKEVEGRLVHTSNFLDVPREWLGEQFYKDAKNLERTQPEVYAHEYMGEAVGRAEQIVFHGKWEIKEFEVPPARECYQGRYFYGADWGFSNDPTVLVKCFIKIENGERDLYISNAVSGVGVELDETPSLFASVPNSKQWKIYADCARPETISHVKRSGYDIEGAKKWDGSVKDGIAYLRSFNKIYIHPRCKICKDEFTKYSYKVDGNTKEILPILVDANNHSIDALRYALWAYIKKKVSILDVI